MSTPYDGKVHLWHVQGRWVSEPDIPTLVRNVRQRLSVPTGLWIKTVNADQWQGFFDTKSSMEINGPSDISRWGSELSRNNIDLHVWTIPEDDNLQREIEITIQSAQVPGVKSLILDVEPFDGQNYWNGSPQDVRTFMTALRSALGDDFHIGISVDPRAHRHTPIHPEAWMPYIDSVHPQIYWRLMGRTPRDVINETYDVWGNYGKAIVPVLQAWDVDEASMFEAQNICRGERGAQSVSWFRWGRIDHYAPMNDTFVEEEIGPDGVERTYDWEQIIGPDDPGFRNGAHSGEPVDSKFTIFTGPAGHLVKSKKATRRADSVWAQWTPTLPSPGLYEISVYIPGQAATSRQARYHIHGVTGVASELLVRLNQLIHSNKWVPMVVYEFTGEQRSGRVNLTDLTGESEDRDIAFSAIRWRRVIRQQKIDQDAPGFDPPVGSEDERLSAKVWPGTWFDATGYAVYYTVVGPSYHTGVDLNNNQPSWDTDRNSPVYSPADGVVTYSGRLGGTWGWVIIIRHDPLPNGEQVYSRMAHVNDPGVRKNDRVKRGEQIARIGNADGQLAYHLHFDIVKTDILERYPGHWPGLDLAAVYQHYHNPRTFIQGNRPPGRS
ncbi:MAG: peptidoglycan DD-metalloendopeptidase family protein [Chloroflexi bacterium]|nr:peptidoglycan DD-metalloendopeptidase family protein [Chloroflexota bacterium]